MLNRHVVYSTASWVSSSLRYYGVRLSLHSQQVVCRVWQYVLS